MIEVISEVAMFVQVFFRSALYKLGSIVIVKLISSTKNKKKQILLCNSKFFTKTS